MATPDPSPLIDRLLRNRRDRSCVRIGIGGGSGAGKSTIAASIQEGLQPMEVEVLRLDRFFKPPDRMPTYHSAFLGGPRPDFNQPDSLDVPAMVAFCRAHRGPHVIIFDGHFSLYYPEMRDLMDVRIFVTVDVEEMLRRRTERNLANNYGGTKENILHYNRECVLPSYEKHIQPTSRFADLIISNDGGHAEERERLIDLLSRKIREREG